jgi:hypothetical protein
MPPAMKIVGVEQMRRDLLRLFDDRRGAALVELKAAGRAAADPVVARTRETLPHKSGKLRDSLRVSPTRSGATIRMGRARVPYAGPVDFGGWPQPAARHQARSRGIAGAIMRLFGRSANPSEGHGRPYLPEGRYLYPAARSEKPKVVELYSAALKSAINRFPWSTPHA